MNRKRHNHRNLKIWQLGTDIMKDIYDITSMFPKKEDFRLTSQLTGCAVSMPSNIAEGSARTNVKYISNEKFEELNNKNNEFQRMMIVDFTGSL